MGLRLRAVLEEDVQAAIRGERPAGMPRDDVRPPAVATFREPRVAWYAGMEDIRLLHAYGLRPRESEEGAAARAEALLAAAAEMGSRWEPVYVVLREGEVFLPPGIPPAGAGKPVAEEGRLRAWRTGDWK